MAPDASSQTVRMAEAIRLLALSDTTIRKLCDRGLFRSIRTPGGHRRILREDVERYLREHVQPQQSGQPDPAAGTG